MTERRELLIEIGTEELPPLALKQLSEKFADGLTAGLGKLGFESMPCKCFATPRRLGVLLHDVPVQQEPQTLKRRGPITKAAFTSDGKPTKAAEGFARSCGVEVAELTTTEENGNEYLYYETVQAGKKTEDVILDIIQQALSGLPIPKRMRWGESDIEFIRPVHWAVVLYAGLVVEGEILGVPTGRQTYGHRVYNTSPITIGIPEDYESNLYQQGKVIACYQHRCEKIKEQIESLMKTIDGSVDLDQDQALLQEVAALVEWPVAIIGSFDEAFLNIPQEVLIMSMKENQKYFPVFDKSGKLTNRFVAISNIQSKDEAKVRTGNERVLRPRLADAQFFWQQDKKQTLDKHVETLKNILFQSKLGSIYDKCQRVSLLSEAVAAHIGADVQLSKRAAELSKADLVTDMVGEFPKLQGIMGRYYALESNEPEEVATAIEQHYWPRFSGDHVPATGVSQSVAIADKVDTLLGIFAAGEKPTGDKDPYALRRAAIGLIRTIIDCELDLDLAELISDAATLYQNDLDTEKASSEVLEFIFNRLHSEYEAGGYTPQQIQAVLARRCTNLLDFDLRVKAVKQFEALPEAESLSAANKRIRNILKKAVVEISSVVRPELLTDPAERAIYDQIVTLNETIASSCKNRDYEMALKRLSALKEPVDQFFDNVMVMVDDMPLRTNRLALLAQLQNLFLEIADISQLQN